MFALVVVVAVSFQLFVITVNETMSILSQLPRWLAITYVNQMG